MVIDRKFEEIMNTQKKRDKPVLRWVTDILVKLYNHLYRKDKFCDLLFTFLYTERSKKKSCLPAV